MRNAPNIFIVSMAVGDLLYVVFTVPTHMANYIEQKNWPFGVAWCKITHTIKFLSLGVSVFTQTDY